MNCLWRSELLCSHLCELKICCRCSSEIFTKHFIFHVHGGFGVFALIYLHFLFSLASPFKSFCFLTLHSQLSSWRTHFLPICLINDLFFTFLLLGLPITFGWTTGPSPSMLLESELSEALRLSSLLKCIPFSFVESELWFCMGLAAFFSILTLHFEG